MERIFSSAPLFFGATKENPTTANCRFHLKDPVDGELLKSVVGEARIRYPYFAVRAELDDGWYVLKENPAPVPVLERAEPVALGGEETDGHLIAFRYSGRELNCEMFHGLTDGGAFLRFLRTVFYYYCIGKYGANHKADGIQRKEDPIPEEEIADPYFNPIDENIAPMGKYVNKGAVQLFPEGRKGAWHTVIKLPENAFVKFSKQHDGSPAVMSALLMARAIRDVLGKTEQPIVCGMAMDIRPVLKTPKAHHSMVSQLFLEYGDRMEKMELMQQATAFRGMVILQSQPENVLTSVQNNIGFVKKLEGLPDLASRKGFMDRIMERAIQGTTFKVSYAGSHSMGAADEYIESVYPLIDIGGAGLMLEISAFGGSFYISYLQESDDDRYLKSFLNQLHEADISYEVDSLSPFTMVNIDFPGAGGDA